MIFKSVILVFKKSYDIHRDFNRDQRRHLGVQLIIGDQLERHIRVNCRTCKRKMRWRSRSRVLMPSQIRKMPKGESMTSIEASRVCYWVVSRGRHKDGIMDLREGEYHDKSSLGCCSQRLSRKSKNFCSN